MHALARRTIVASLPLLVGPWLINVPAVAAKADHTPIDFDAAAMGVVERTNRFRKEHQLPAVEVNEALQQTAQSFADFMAKNDKYGHHADGRTPSERVTAAGYEWCAVRENIAYRTDTRQLDEGFLAEHFTQGWIDSPEHRENMLADYVTETGVAIASADGVTFYAVQLFGRPESQSYRVAVTNETDTTYTLKIDSNGGADEFDLSPRSGLRMRRCFPTKLSLAGEQAERVVKESVDLTIQRHDDGPVFE